MHAARAGLIRGAEALNERHEAEHFAQVSRDDLRIDVTRALESLPELYREVILLRDMEQLTIGEAADHLGITREACKSRIHRGRMLDAHPNWSVAAGLLALVAMRGCPVCWAIGLAETMQQRLRR